MSFDPERYAAGLRAANERERAEIDRRTAEALREAHRLATEIGRFDPSVKRVVLKVFRSLLIILSIYLYSKYLQRNGWVFDCFRV